MSRFHTETATCAACGKPLEVDVVASIHADRRADLRAAVLDDTLQRGHCPACETPYRLDPQLTYVDATRGLWVLVKPAGALAEWAELEETARTAFARAYGEESPADARAVGARLKARIVFGWAGLREKVLCAEHGIDDVLLELAKLSILRSSEEPPLADDIELRLVAADSTTLTVEWCVAAGDARLESFAVPRTLLADIDRDAGWRELRAEVSAGPFVDLNRTLVEAAG